MVPPLQARARLRHPFDPAVRLPRPGLQWRHHSPAALSSSGMLTTLQQSVQLAQARPATTSVSMRASSAACSGEIEGAESSDCIPATVEYGLVTNR